MYINSVTDIYHYLNFKHLDINFKKKKKKYFRGPKSAKILSIINLLYNHALSPRWHWKLWKSQYIFHFKVLKHAEQSYLCEWGVQQTTALPLNLESAHEKMYMTIPQQANTQYCAAKHSQDDNQMGLMHRSSNLS